MFFKDYVLDIQYHPSEANVVADAQSRKTHHSLKSLLVIQPAIRWPSKFRNRGRAVGCKGMFNVYGVQSNLIDEIT